MRRQILTVLWINLLSFVLAACGGTPPGEIATFSLLGELSEEIQAAAPSPTSNLMLHRSVELEIEEGTVIRVNWDTFTWNGWRIVASVQIEAVEVARGMEIDFGTFGEISNIGPEEFQIMSVPVSILWRQESFTGQTGGVVVGNVNGDGTYDFNLPPSP